MVFSYLMLVATSGDTGSAVAHGFQSFVGKIVSLFKMIFSCSCLQSQENDLILYLSQDGLILHTGFSTLTSS